MTTGGIVFTIATLAIRGIVIPGCIFLAIKKVAIGPVGSGTSENAKQILEAWGLSVEHLAKGEQLTASQSADYIKDGRLDAAFFTVAVGAAVIMDTSLIVDVNIVPIDGCINNWVFL